MRSETQYLGVDCALPSHSSARLGGYDSFFLSFYFISKLA